MMTGMWISVGCGCILQKDFNTFLELRPNFPAPEVTAGDSIHSTSISCGTLRGVGVGEEGNRRLMGKLRKFTALLTNSRLRSSF